MENYKPRTNKPLSAHTIALFSHKSEKQPKDTRQQLRDKFRLDMKNALSLPKNMKYSEYSTKK